MNHSSEIKEMRKRAQQDMSQGAVTADYQANRERVIELLNEALATELVCVLRYKRHYETVRGIHAETVAAEFLEHANEEQAHADSLAGRIGMLNGEPNMNPDGLSARSHTQYVECDTLLEMIRENLIAERIAIESYGRMIREIGDGDPSSRRLLEGILENEEEHADDLARMLEVYQSEAA